MPTLQKVGVLLTAEGLKELDDMSHLFDSSIYGQLFCCESVDTGDDLLKMAVKFGASPIELHVPMRFVRAIFNLADLAQLDVFHEPTKPPPLNEQQLIAAIQKDVVKASIQKGTEVPIELLRSLYHPTPFGLITRAFEILVGQGFLDRQPGGKYVLK